MIDQFLIGNHRNFVYLLTFDGQSIVVDPQVDLKPWQSRLQEIGSKLIGVLLTHTHWDHIAGVPGIVSQSSSNPKWPPIYVHELEARRFQKSSKTILERLSFVKDEDLIPIGSQKIEVLHTPGHSSGECCYLLKTTPSWQLLTGDTVFVGDVGRTDLETGSTVDLFKTIQRLKKLPPQTILYPGHHYGRTPTSTIAQECLESKAFQCQSVEELDALP